MWKYFLSLLALRLLLSVRPCYSSDGAGRRLDEDADGTTGNEDAVNNDDKTTSGAVTRDLIDLVELVPFFVHINRTVAEDLVIPPYEVTNIVTDWMNQAYRTQLQSFGYTEENLYAEFDFVVLFDNNDQRERRSRRIRCLQQTELFTFSFKGGAVFSRNAVRTKSVPTNDVLLIQQVILLSDATLTILLQESSVPGLAAAVVDAKASFIPTTVLPSPQPSFSKNPTPSSEPSISLLPAISSEPSVNHGPTTTTEPMPTAESSITATERPSFSKNPTASPEPSISFLPTNWPTTN